MGIPLPMEPTPENLPLLADYAVRMARDVSGIDLDYTPASLKHVDQIIDSVRGGAESEAMNSLVYFMGCYAGEVIIRNTTGSVWHSGPNDALPMVHIKQGEMTGMINPIGKAFKLFDKGLEDSLDTLYKALQHKLEKGFDQ